MEKLEELYDQKSKELEMLKFCKEFVNKCSYDQYNDWLDTISKQEIFFLMYKFSQDSEMQEKLNILEAFYKNKF